MAPSRSIDSLRRIMRQRLMELPRYRQLLLSRDWWRFQWRYLRGLTPWDTQITPPEVMEFIGVTPPGRALDLGCGTGTNAITLTRYGWRVTGVDFVPQAVEMARRKARRAGLQIDFINADVTQLDILVEPFDYILDIGCLVSVPAADRVAYGANINRLLRPRGWYMLYGWLPRCFKGRRAGIASSQIADLLGDTIVRRRMVIGEEQGGPSAWYWFQRR